MKQCYWCKRETGQPEVKLPLDIVEGVRAKVDPELPNPVRLCGHCEGYFLGDDETPDYVTE